MKVFEEHVTRSKDSPINAKRRLLEAFLLYSSLYPLTKGRKTKKSEKTGENQNLFLLGRISPFMSKVAVGGTFQYFHDGHVRLIKKAFEIAKNGKVYIGLTSDEMLQKTHNIDSYESRKELLLQCIKEMGFSEEKFEVTKLDDPCGPSLEEDFDYIVVSPETYPVALKINRIREKRGKNPLEIIYVEYVLAEDGIPISSTRISEGEINRHGKLKNKTKA